MTKLEELYAAYKEATHEQAASLEAGVAMQAKMLDFGELAHNLMPALLEAVEVIACLRRDTGLVALMRPDQVERINTVLEKLK